MAPERALVVESEESPGEPRDLLSALPQLEVLHELLRSLHGEVGGMSDQQQRRSLVVDPLYVCLDGMAPTAHA